MNSNEIRNKFLSGDSGSLSGLKANNKNSHPAEVAQMLANLPAETSLQAFQPLPTNNQVKVFPCLDLLVQKKIINGFNKTRAEYILNELTSDERMIFLSSLKGIDLSWCLD